MIWGCITEYYYVGILILVFQLFDANRDSKMSAVPVAYKTPNYFTQVSVLELLTAIWVLAASMMS